MRDLLENIYFHGLMIVSMSIYAIYGHKNFYRLFEKLEDLDNNGK
jgi:hypothetical protein